LKAEATSEPPKWDFERELERDLRFERSLIWRELAVIAFIAALVVLRVLFVH